MDSCSYIWNYVKVYIYTWIYENMFYANKFYKRSEAEIPEIVKWYFKNKPEAEILKRT